MEAGRPDLFPPDRGLQLRMVLALAAAAVLTIVYGGLLVAIATVVALSGSSDAHWLALMTRRACAR